MNEKKWMKRIVEPIRLAKLMEEMGEVGEAFISYHACVDLDRMTAAREHLIEELGHVELMANLYRRQLQGEF